MAAPYNPPKKNEDFIIRIALQDKSKPGHFRDNPTIASGDFKVKIDDGSYSNLSTTPVAAGSGSVDVKLTLSNSEMNGDYITIVGRDQTSPAEWGDFFLCIPTTA